MALDQSCICQKVTSLFRWQKRHETRQTETVPTRQFGCKMGASKWKFPIGFSSCRRMAVSNSIVFSFDWGSRAISPSFGQHERCSSCFTDRKKAPVERPPRVSGPGPECRTRRQKRKNPARCRTSNGSARGRVPLPFPRAASGAGCLMLQGELG